MNDNQGSVWHRLVAAIKPFSPAVRVKWSGDPEPTAWEPWIIVSSLSYLETGTLGPVRFHEVEWVEFDLTRRSASGRLIAARSEEWREAVVEAIRSAGVRFSTSGATLRIAADAA